MRSLNLVLCSQSLSRKKLLKRLKIPFVTAAPQIDETPHSKESATDLVKRLAIEKTRANIKKFPNSLLIGCDQVAVIEKKLVSKPEDYPTAFLQLKKASGKRIDFFTGLCLLNSSTNHYQVIVENYQAFYRKLSVSMIKNYLEIEKPYHCAGSIQVEGLGIALLERLEGNDPTAIIGLPLIALVNMLKNEGFDILESHPERNRNPL